MEETEEEAVVSHRIRNKATRYMAVPHKTWPVGEVQTQQTILLARWKEIL